MSSNHRDLVIQILVAQTLNVSRRTELSIAFVRAATLATRTLLADPSVCWTRIVLVIKAAHVTSVLIHAQERVAPMQIVELPITSLYAAVKNRTREILMDLVAPYQFWVSIDLNLSDCSIF